MDFIRIFLFLFRAQEKSLNFCLFFLNLSNLLIKRYSNKISKKKQSRHNYDC